MHLRGLFFFLFFFAGGARRSIRIHDSQDDAQQQDNTLAKRLELSAGAREALIPGFFGTRIFSRAGPQAGALREESKQDGRRAGYFESDRSAPFFRLGPLRAKVALQAASGPEEGQLPPKEADSWDFDAAFFSEDIQGRSPPTRKQRPRRVGSPRACAAMDGPTAIELTRDFGRGSQHLSACLEDGDVVSYMVGTWEIDSVAVGDGSPSRLRFARVDFFQINWTQSSEHGVIGGTALDVDWTASDESQLTFKLQDGDDIQFGPEQLVARLRPASWADDGQSVTTPPLPSDLEAIIEGLTR